MMPGISRNEMDAVTLAYMPPVPPEYSGTLRRLSADAEQLTLESITLALVTSLRYKLHLNAATIMPLYLCIVVRQSLPGGVIASATVAAATGAYLVYFSFPPIFLFRIDAPLERLTSLTFLAMTHAVTWLVSDAGKALRDNETRLCPRRPRTAFEKGIVKWRANAISHQMVSLLHTGK